MSFVVYVLATLKELISNKSAAEEQSKHTARPPPPRRKHALRDAHIVKTPETMRRAQTHIQDQTPSSMCAGSNFFSFFSRRRPGNFPRF